MVESRRLAGVDSHVAAPLCFSQELAFSRTLGSKGPPS